MKFTVAAVSRPPSGRGVVRRLRRAGQVPGVVYGIGQPQAIAVDGHRLGLDLNYEAFHSSVLDLELDGKVRQVLLREVQTHPVSGALVHVDFQAVASDVAISATVPVHYDNADAAPGVRLNHGIFSVTVAELQIHCLPRDLPGNIAVDVAHLEINQSVHLQDIAAPAGVTFDALGRGENPVLATVLPPKDEVEPADPAKAEGDAAAAEAEAK